MKYSPIEKKNAMYPKILNFRKKPPRSSMPSWIAYILYAIKLAKEPNRLPKPPALTPHKRDGQLVVNFASKSVAGTLLIT